MRCSEAIFKNKTIRQSSYQTDRNEKDFKNHDIVAFAFEAGSEITRWLISIGQSINATDDCDRTP